MRLLWILPPLGSIIIVILFSFSILFWYIKRGV